MLHHIDGRRLAKCDERWLVAGVSNELTESGSGGEVLKSRLMPETEYLGWRVAGLQRQIASLTAELDASRRATRQFRMLPPRRLPLGYIDNYLRHVRTLRRRWNPCHTLPGGWTGIPSV